MIDREEILRRLTLGDVTCLEAVAAERGTRPRGASLDHIGEALVKLGALMATDGSDLTWQLTVRTALDAGLTPDEIVDALVVLAPVIGRTRVVDDAPRLALAVGYDVTAALENR